MNIVYPEFTNSDDKDNSFQQRSAEVFHFPTINPKHIAEKYYMMQLAEYYYSSHSLALTLIDLEEYTIDFLNTILDGGTNTEIEIIYGLHSALVQKNLLLILIYLRSLINYYENFFRNMNVNDPEKIAILSILKNVKAPISNLFSKREG